jgi:hypothetical protein
VARASTSKYAGHMHKLTKIVSTEERLAADELADKVYDSNLLLEALTQLLVESQEQGQEGWGQYGASETTMRLVNGDAIRVQPEPYTVTENADEIRQYFIDNGLIRKLTPPWMTINALNKERLLNGESELPGTKLYVKTKLVFTPNGPAKKTKKQQDAEATGDDL